MNGFFAAAFAASLSVVGATSAQAMPLAPIGGAQDSLIERAAQGCGRGYERDRRGFCRPSFDRPRYDRPGYDRPRFVAPAPRPIIVAPARRPVIVHPGRACPPGFFLSPRGNCRPR